MGTTTTTRPTSSGTVSALVRPTLYSGTIRKAIGSVKMKDLPALVDEHVQKSRKATMAIAIDLLNRGAEVDMEYPHADNVRIDGSQAGAILEIHFQVTIAERLDTQLACVVDPILRAHGYRIKD